MAVSSLIGRPPQSAEARRRFPLRDSSALSPKGTSIERTFAQAAITGCMFYPWERPRPSIRVTKTPAVALVSATGSEGVKEISGTANVFTYDEWGDKVSHVD